MNALRNEEREESEIEQIERRLLRAAQTLLAIPDPDAKFRGGHKTSWPEPVRNAHEAYGFEPVRTPRFRPSPQDIDDMLVALAWGRDFDKAEWDTVFWRAKGFSFRWIGDRLSVSHETARTWYRYAVAKALRARRLG